jgi:hypothetical protein
MARKGARRSFSGTECQQLSHTDMRVRRTWCSVSSSNRIPTTRQFWVQGQGTNRIELLEICSAPRTERNTHRHDRRYWVGCDFREWLTSIRCTPLLAECVSRGFAAVYHHDRRAALSSRLHHVLEHTATVSHPNGHGFLLWRVILPIAWSIVLVGVSVTVIGGSTGWLYWLVPVFIARLTAAVRSAWELLLHFGHDEARDERETAPVMRQ